MCIGERRVGAPRATRRRGSSGGGDAARPAGQPAAAAPVAPAPGRRAAPARSRLSVVESGEAAHRVAAALGSPASPPPRPAASTHLNEKTLQLTEVQKSARWL